jgi:hypothetical protein
MSGEQGSKKRSYNEQEELIQELKRQLTEKDSLLTEKNSLLAEKDSLLAEKDSLLAEKDEKLKSKSLLALFPVTDHVSELYCIGSKFSNTNPRNHLSAELEQKAFALSDMTSIVEQLKLATGQDPELESLSSGVLAEFEKNQGRKNYANETEVAFFVNLALRDAVKICNALLSLAVTRREGTFTQIELEVRQEMSIFSNRCDHAVVVDAASSVPVFCVETKKHFENGFDSDFDNQLLGQSFDQLYAMRLSGQRYPLGAITCFNKTYLTCLDPEISWDALPTLESLNNTIAHLPRKRQPDTTPSPLKVESAITSMVTARKKKGFVEEKNRCTVRSENCIDQKHIVAAFVIVILNAVKGNCKPTSYQVYTSMTYIDVDCIEMGKKSYQWGKLTTTAKGECYKKMSFFHRDVELYLLYCIGTGSTSKAFHAITLHGYECVVKIYTQRHDDHGRLKTERKFKSDAKKHVKEEVKQYHKIYGNELENYVWHQEVYKSHAVILPFFRPVVNREAEIQNIKDRLELFTKHKLAFRECDQCWRHIGRFKEELYLFDLGDLETCTDKEAAKNHLKRLMTRANIPVSI